MRKLKEGTVPSMYYRAPEGQDIVGKLLYTSKYTGYVGLCCGIVDAQLLTKPKGLLGAFGRIGYYVVPLVGMSATFVATTYIATNLRKKDDKWNYALGGAVAGTIIGAWKRSFAMGSVAAIAFAVSGIIKKEAVDAGMEIFPFNEVVAQRTLGSKHFDFTLAKEIPGNWTTGRD